MEAKGEWDAKCHRVFVELCVEQREVWVKPRMHHMLEPFRERTGASFNKKELENHWDTMIKQWKIWRTLVDCNVMKWDPVTKTFGASDHDWTNYLHVFPDAGKYRLGLPLYLEKLETIFEGINIDEEVVLGNKRKQRSRLRDEGRQRVNWPQSSHKLFLNLLVEEALKGNLRPDKKYPKGTWRIIQEKIYRTTGKKFTNKQVKNHWDVTRKSWKIWCDAVGDTNLKWDPDTRRFGATEEEWRIHLKKYPRSLQFKRKQVPDADKLAIIFKGIIEPGKYFQGRVLLDPTPSSKVYNNEPSTGNEDSSDDAEDEDDDDDEDSDDDVLVV